MKPTVMYVINEYFKDTLRRQVSSPAPYAVHVKRKQELQRNTKILTYKIERNEPKVAK